jgi:hypothetical protein
MIRQLNAEIEKEGEYFTAKVCTPGIDLKVYGRSAERAYAFLLAEVSKQILRNFPPSFSLNNCNNTEKAGK